MQLGVFLDRDGVLNRPVVREGRPFAPTSLEQFELLPGVSQACSRMRERGLVLIVVTNQPDVARGVSSQELVERMHQKLRESVPLDDIRVCFHDSLAGCNCRKPRPGLLVDAAKDWKVDLCSSFMVGDRWRDIDAGQAAGCRTIFIDHAYRESLRSAPDRRVASLSEAVDWILKQAERAGMLEMYRNPLIRGFTTNPTLMRKAGISDYRAFAKEIVRAVPDRPISFE